MKTVNLDSLTLYEKNANIHPDAQIDQLANSITEWGWTIPILIDENSQIIAGHGRYYAAKKLGMNSAPCITITGWSEKQKRAYVLADNKWAENSKWPDELLKAELSEILSEGYDLNLLGFEQFDFDNDVYLDLPNTTKPATEFDAKDNVAVKVRIRIINTDGKVLPAVTSNEYLLRGFVLDLRKTGSTLLFSFL